jgi:hypothetical protein
MVTHIDGSVYFWSLLFSSGLLYSGYRAFVNNYNDYRDNIIRDLTNLLRTQTANIVEMEKELSLRRLVNDPTFFQLLRKEFDDMPRLIPENESERPNDTNTKNKEE